MTGMRAKQLLIHILFGDFIFSALNDIILQDLTLTQNKSKITSFLSFLKWLSL